jgi:hypothetical protein
MGIIRTPLKIDNMSDVNLTGRSNKSRLSWSTGNAEWEMGDPEAEQMIINTKAAEDGIAEGDWVYFFGQSGNEPTIKKAKSDSAATMPAAGRALDSGDTDDDIRILTYGLLNNTDTSTYAIREGLYISASVAGAHTNVKPTGTALVQKIAVVTEVNVAGNIFVSGANRTNDIPNIPEGQVWFGDSSGVPIASDVIADMNMTGGVSWGGAGDYYDEAFPGGEFRLLRAPTYRIGGKAITASVPQDTGVLSANATHYIYLDSSGLIQSTTTRTAALFKDNFVIFEVLYDGTNYVVVKEDHPYDYQAAISNDLHDTQGTVFEKNDSGVLDRVTTGTGSVATDRQAKQVGASEIHDHGIESSFADSSGAAVSFEHYYTNGSGFYNRDSSSATFPMKYNNAGTATALTTNRFGVFRIGYSKDDKNTAGGKRISLMHTAEFTTQNLAQTAINNGTIVNFTNELASLEMAQYGYIIVKNTAAGGHLIAIITEKDVVGGSITQSGGANNASAINTDTTNFDGILSSADTTAQAAFETLSGAGASIAETNTGTATDKVVTPDGLAGSNYGTDTLEIGKVESDTSVTVADGTVGILITPKNNGWDIVNAIAGVHTKGITGTTNIQIRRRRAGLDVDVLSTPITIGDEWFAEDGVINTSNDDLQTGDLLYYDTDSIHSGTAPSGLTVAVEIRKP